MIVFVWKVVSKTSSTDFTLDVSINNIKTTFYQDMSFCCDKI